MLSSFSLLIPNFVSVFEIQKYDCLKNGGVFLPSNVSKVAPESLWMQYTDSVYVPFDCPKEPDGK